MKWHPQDTSKKTITKAVVVHGLGKRLIAAERARILRSRGFALIHYVRKKKSDVQES